MEQLAGREAAGSNCWRIFDNTVATLARLNALAALTLVPARAR
jgi:hypothetical protein